MYGSDTTASESVDAVLKSMTSEEITRMLRREGIDFQKITDREQLLDMARQVLISRVGQPQTPPKKSYFWNVFMFATAWTLLRMYSSGGLSSLARELTNALFGNSDAFVPTTTPRDTDDFFDE
jgi:hypothetical protein